MLGYWAGWPKREDQKALALATALGNPALALAVAEVSYPRYSALVPVSVYLVVHGTAILPLEWWLKRRRHQQLA